jgi:hypothetical protein
MIPSESGSRPFRPLAGKANAGIDSVLTKTPRGTIPLISIDEFVVFADTIAYGDPGGNLG